MKIPGEVRVQLSALVKLAKAKVGTILLKKVIVTLPK